jgi:hypothetical protein
MIRPVIAILSAIAVIGMALLTNLYPSTLTIGPYDDALTQEPARFAQRYFSLINEKSWDAVAALSDRGLRDSNAQNGFRAMANLIPNSEPMAVHIVGIHSATSYFFGINTSGSSGVERVDVTLEYLFPDKPLLANVVLRRDGDSFLVETVQARPLKQPLEQYYEFRLFDQDLIDYVILLGAALLILFDAYALAQCIMMPGLRLKWLWIIFILLGAGRIQYNLTDGVWSYAMLYVHFPVVGLTQVCFQSLIVSGGLPIGAVAFWIRHKLLAVPEEADSLHYE